jgi:hypothetical protein
LQSRHSAKCLHSKTKKLLHNKRNLHQIEEAAQQTGENLGQLYIEQRINELNMQGAQKSKLPKIQ